MSIHSRPPIINSNLLACFDAANIKSYSANVFPQPTDAFAWASPGGGYQMTLTRDGSVTDSPAGGIPLKIVTSGSSAYTGTYNSSTWNLAPAASGQTWTFSFWVKGATAHTASLMIFEANSSGNYTTLGQVFYNVTTSWTRVSGSYTMTQGTTAFVQARIDNYNTGVTMWVDGLQLERNSARTTFNSQPNINGTRWSDIVGKRNGTLNNTGPTYDVLNNGGLIFDGVDDNMTTTMPISTTPALSNWSYEVWTRITAWPTAVSPPNGYNNATRCGVLFGASYYAGAALYWYGNSSGNACTMYGYLRGADAYRNTPGFNMSLNTTYQFVMVNNYSGNSIQLYVNGILHGSTPAATQEYNPSLTPGLNIGLSLPQVDGGGEANYSYYPGRIFSAKIYSSALSSSQVLQNFNGIRGRYGI